jgi:hypothetical protein
MASWARGRSLIPCWADHRRGDLEDYDPARDVTPQFLARVADWIRVSGEALVVLRYLRAAGAKDFALCRSMDEFKALVAEAPPGTDIEVFRDKQVPLRGVVTDTFADGAVQAIPEGGEYLIMSLATKPGTRLSIAFDMGVSHAELREGLAGLRGHEVALGPCPAFSAADHEGLVSASKGGIDGPR